MIELHTPAEAAELLKVSRDTVYTLIHTRELPSVKIRGQYRVRGIDLENYISEALGWEA
ncbi:helix-turn-helix domain-containing protein [Tindallia californiensis]|uniref:Putative molybdopterin biosynthesis protein n=1 Tax=Tindallia californiensis TaxID=159292 RepID=A0A1H3REZ3_9FIRM|nr:helix-turn-helix domain-containing protein [Tindallia californiensis]SDZ24206.1 putative molybdopterin biosynthesis protein [Tindallia californiensis]